MRELDHYFSQYWESAGGFESKAQHQPIAVPALVYRSADGGIVRVARLPLARDAHAAVHTDRLQRIGGLIAAAFGTFRRQLLEYFERHRGRALVRATRDALDAPEHQSLRDLAVALDTVPQRTGSLPDQR